MPTWAWIVVGIVAALIVLAVLATAARKKQVEHKREEAAEIREDAERWGSKVEQRDADARQVEAEAERLRAEADELAAIAEQRRMRADAERAEHQKRLSEADEIDPDVDTQGESRTDPAAQAAEERASLDTSDVEAARHRRAEG